MSKKYIKGSDYFTLPNYDGGIYYEKVGNYFIDSYTHEYSAGSICCGKNYLRAFGRKNKKKFMHNMKNYRILHP